MFTAEQIYEFCRDRSTSPIPKRPEYDRLYGVLGEFSNSDIEELLSNIERGDDILPRLLDALSFRHRSIDAVDALKSFIDTYKFLMPNFLPSEDCERWNRVEFDESIMADDEDLSCTVFGEFGDWIANHGPDADHPIGMLSEALYSIRNDYLIADYVRFPLNSLRSQLEFDPLEDYFQLAVSGFRIVFDGYRVNAIQ